MKVKTYGVPELTEWHGKVKAGNIEVAVSFTGGTSSPSGAQPAYFVTKDPITQFVIENSKEFRNGFIIPIMTQEVPGNHPRMATPNPRAAIAPAQEAPAKDEPTKDEPIESVAEDNDIADTPAAGLKEVEVTCLQDAQDYLQQNFGISSYKVRSRAAAQKAAAEHGVVFVGNGFSAAEEDSDNNADA